MCKVLPRNSRCPPVIEKGRVAEHVPKGIPHGNNGLPFGVLRRVGQ